MFVSFGILLAGVAALLFLYGTNLCNFISRIMGNCLGSKKNEVNEAPVKAKKETQQQAEAPKASKVEVDYEALREESREHRRLMAEAFEKSKVAYNEDRKDDAKTLSDEGSQHQKMYKEKDKMAAQAVFNEKNAGRPRNEIDLHGLYVDEAMDFMTERVEDLLKDNQPTIDIITGRGSHSDKGIPKIKPKVEEWLKEQSYEWEEVNAGDLRVTLSTSS